MAQAPMKTKLKKSDAYIIDHEDRLLVRPKVVVLRRNDSFEICNLTGEQAQIDLSCIGAGSNVTIVPGDWLSVTVDPGTQPGPKSYVVKVGGRRAHGESDPVIIIDP